MLPTYFIGQNGNKDILVAENDLNVVFSTTNDCNIRKEIRIKNKWTI
jgi:hypothetical protein